MFPLDSVLGILLAVALPVAAQTYFEPEDLDQDGVISAAEIMEAVNAAGDAGGGRVFLRASRHYVLEAPVVIRRDNVVLRGEAMGDLLPNGTLHGVVLNVSGDLAGTAVRIEDCSGSGLSNLTVIGHSGMRADAAAILLENTRRSLLESVRVSRASNGIDIVNGDGTTLKRVHVEQLFSSYGVRVRGSGAGGIDTGAMINHLLVQPANASVDALRVGPWVRNLDIQDSRLLGGRTGLLVEGDPAGGESAPRLLQVNQLLVQGAAQHGIHIRHGQSVQLTNVVVIGGQPGSPMEGSGILVADSFESRLLISNLYLRGAGKHGIEVRGGVAIQIVNSMFVGNGHLALSQSAGIWLANAVRNVLISGGRSGAYREQAELRTQRYGVFFDGTAQQASDQSIQVMAVDTKENEIGLSPAALKWQTGN